MTRVATAAVLAAYNQAEYIEEAVASLAPQVDRVVVVDDHSTDTTWNVLESLRCTNLRVMRNERRLGVSRSLTRAIIDANADVILIQGGDDRSLPDRAARQVAALAEPGVALVASLPAIIDARGRALPNDVAGEFFSKPDAADPLVHLFFAANYICAPSVAMRTDDYLRLGGFPAGIDLLQDHALWLALAAVGSIVIDERPVVEYRKHGTNLSREYTGADALRERRHDAERDWILASFLESAAMPALQRLAEARGIRVDDRLEADLRTLLLLAHGDKPLRRRGLARLFDVVAGDSSDESLARLGLDEQDIANFAVLADHGNVDAVNAALNVTRRLAARAPEPGSRS